MPAYSVGDTIHFFDTRNGFTQHGVIQCAYGKPGGIHYVLHCVQPSGAEYWPEVAERDITGAGAG